MFWTADHSQLPSFFQGPRVLLDQDQSAADHWMDGRSGSLNEFKVIRNCLERKFIEAHRTQTTNMALRCHTAVPFLNL